MHVLNHSSRQLATMVMHRAGTLKTMVDYWDRLQVALKHASKSLKDLQEHLGVSYQAMKKVADGKTKALSAENHSRAARFLGVNGHWLATGEESMLNQTPSGWEKLEESGKILAQDRLADYIGKRDITASPWPFSTVTYAEYTLLTDLQKGLVEGYTKRLVEESRPTKSNGTHGS